MSVTRPGPDLRRQPSPQPEGTPTTTAAGRPVNVSAYPSHSILKRAPWTWMIPAYFFFGGMAGAAALIGEIAELAGQPKLAGRARLAAMAALLPCPPLLILDLGRPERFYNMLRVFRPTSPMNLGTWILTGFGGGLSAALASQLTGLMPRLGRLGGGLAGALGPPLATYTGVLLANTSTPAWHAARRYLPALFAAGAAASGGAATCLLAHPRDAAAARRIAIGGALGEIALARTMEHRLGDAGHPYREGSAGHYGRSAIALLGAGALALALAGRRRPGAVAGSLLILGGACCERFAVWKAGDRSAELS